MLTSPKDPETTLRRLNEAGVFGRFVPDFGRVVAQMQHDMYHVLHGGRAHDLRASASCAASRNGKYKEDRCRSPPR